ncbi:MAG: AMP-binding protein [Polyangiaceae bacterium]|nr:AMP-binding protein [Polyangiaceae bacterium]
MPSRLFGALDLDPTQEAALVSPDGGMLLSYAELEGRVWAFAALLQHPEQLAPDLEGGDALRQLAGLPLDSLALSVGSLIRPLDNLALLSKNRAEYLEVVLGAIAGGAWLTPLNWHLSSREVAYILTDSGSRLVIVDPELEGLLPEGFPRLILGERYEQALDRGSRVAREAPMNGKPGGTRIYTSGTSGRPKGVERQRATDLDAAWEALRAAGRALGLEGRRGDGTPHTHLITGPMYHAAPLMFAVYDLMNGARVSVLPRFSEQAFSEAVSALRVSHTHVVPTMCVRLLRLDADARRALDTSSLELVLHGAAPISPGIKRQMIEWWGPLLVEYWGATEGGVYTLIDSQDWLEHPGSVGKPLPKFEVFALDDELQRMPPGSVGTLYCRHRELPTPFVYHRAEDKTRACYLEPHVFTAGDLGHVDEDGYVFLSARRSNLILSGGVNIYPAEIEGAFLESPWVGDVAAYGVPDEEWGERACVAIELSEAGASERNRIGDQALSDALLASLDGHLARYKWPRELRIVDALPRLPTGKIRHEALRALGSS